MIYLKLAYALGLRTQKNLAAGEPRYFGFLLAGMSSLGPFYLLVRLALQFVSSELAAVAYQPIWQGASIAYLSALLLSALLTWLYLDSRSDRIESEFDWLPTPSSYLHRSGITLGVLSLAGFLVFLSFKPILISTIGTIVVLFLVEMAARVVTARGVQSGRP